MVKYRTPGIGSYKTDKKIKAERMKPLPLMNHPDDIINKNFSAIMRSVVIPRCNSKKT